MKRTLLIPLALVPASALLLAGCSSSATDTSTTAASDDAGITIVASTNVYGDIASQIAGDGVTITSLISSSAQDPHSYEASAQDQLAIKDADVIIENGGGYDPFVDSLADASGTDAVILNAAEISGLLPSDADANSDEEIEGFNEHVWYDFGTVDKVASSIADELSEIDADNADAYAANYTAFSEKISGLEDELSSLSDQYDGTGVAITEPVPLYLLEGAGLVNKTPDDFSEAIEEGDDVSPATLQEVLDLIDSGDVALLAYNEQTSGPTTEQVKEEAESASVPVVSFTETLPDGTDYVGWMTDNIDAVSEALS